MTLIPLLLLISDGAAGDAARAQAIALARELGAPLIGVHLLPRWTAPIADLPIADAVSQQAFDASARAHGEALVQQATREALAAGLDWQPLTLTATQAVPALCELAAQRHCRLIVVGTDSHSAVWRLLGGDPVPGLISHAPAPVLVCKP